MKKLISATLIISLLLTLLLTAFPAYAADPTISIELDKNTAKQGDYITATIRVENITARNIVVPVHFNPSVVKVADSEGKIVLSGVKSATEARNGSVGLIPGQSLSGETSNNEPLYWNGAFFDNPQYPALDNEKGFYRLLFSNTRDKEILNETLVSIKFVAIGEGNADIRFAVKGDETYDVTAENGPFFTFRSEDEMLGAEKSAFSTKTIPTLNVTGDTSVTPPPVQTPKPTPPPSDNGGTGGGGGGGTTTTITPPVGSASDTLIYEFTVPEVENLLSRAANETGMVLRAKIEAGSNITKFIIKMPIEAVDLALGAFVFDTEFVTHLGNIGFDNELVMENAKADSQFVICTLTKTEKSVTIDGVPLKRAGFEDLSEEHWAYNYIMTLVADGYLNGMSETEFAPDANVTREQFATMLVSAKHIYDDTASCDFIDLDESHWAYRQVASAVNAGIIKGYDDGTFGLGRNITREEMAAMVARANENLTQVKDLVDFIDKNEISEWALESVEKMQMADIISGFEDNSFRPQENATRAQAAKIMYGILFLT